MRYFVLLYFTILTLDLSAQQQLSAKNLPDGIRQSGWTLKEHDNLVRVYCYRDFKQYYGVYNLDGQEILPCIFTEVHDLPFGLAVRDSHGKYGLCSYTGDVILETLYSNRIVGYDLDGYIRINIGGIDDDDDGYNPIGGKWGIFDTKGEIIVPCAYDDCQYANENLFAINIGGMYIKDKIEGGKWGLFGDGREILPCIYDERPVFVNGVATLKKDGEVRLVKNPLKDASQIQIAQTTSSKKRRQVTSRYPAPDSDVDKNIPTAKVPADYTFAFIIANENYPEAPVPYSLNDGRMFKEYCHKALGLPEKNINLYEDATFGNIITAVEKMKQIADAYEGDASVIFYYAGHGFPDEKLNTAYLLPIDGNASDITTTGYSLAKLYQELSELKLKSSIVFLDACFSGTKREDQMLSESRGVALKVKEETPKGNMLVFSAAQGDETAHQMEEKHHGLFTYYLLKELQATGGDVDMGTLTEYVTKQVKRQSVVINNKKQTPTVIPSQSLRSNWQSMKLK